MWLLSNQYTQDNYTPPNIQGSLTLDRIRADRLTIRVHNAAIYIQRRTPGPGGDEGDWDREVLYVPGFYTTTRRAITGVRARSAITGQPALITIEALAPGE